MIYPLIRLFIMVAILLSTMMNNLSSQVNLIPNADFEDVKELCWKHTNDSFVYYFQFSFYFLNAWISDIHVPYVENLDTILYLSNLYFSKNYGTPDLFHPCLPHYLYCNSITNNMPGYQLSYNGTGHLGIGIVLGHFGSPVDYYREFARVQLKDTLKKGQGYCFKYRYSISDINGRAASHLGAVFSADSFFVGRNNVEISRKPQVYADYIMCEDLDTANWKLFKGSFVAEGGERWLTLGWFHHLDSIKYIITGLYNQSIFFDENWAYYYLDALELIECPQYGVPDYEIIPPNVISPNGDGLNDAFFIHPYLPQPSSLIIYNRWGAEVFRSANYDQTWQGTTTDGKPVAEGTYFYVLQLPSGTVKKGTVSVFR